MSFRLSSLAWRAHIARLAQPGLQPCGRGRLASSNSHTARCFASDSGNDTAGAAGSSQPGWRVKMLYDGDCPLCMREVEMLKRRDAGKGNIAFVDIASSSYDPQENAGISYEQAMEKIHAILPDGTVQTNVAVFRTLYEQVGLGWVYAATRVPLIGALAEWLYGIWARFRLPLTGRPDLAQVMEEKKSCKI